MTSQITIHDYQVPEVTFEWVQVPEGATIPEGTLYRVEFPQGGASEHISVEPMVSKSTERTTR